MTATTARAAQRPRSLNDVKGWFPSLDQVLFDRFLTRQERHEQHGDLLEMGAYMGKSAIFTAAYLGDDECFTVCDLFDADAPDERNAAEARKSYATLTRTAFEQNYLAFHDELPRVIQGPTSVVPRHVGPDSCRFVHVDASHLYEHVVGDIDTAHSALAPGGLVVLDDFRSEHTPGVAAAAWEAVFTRGLRPVCLSTQKLYGTWGDPGPLQDELLADEEWRSTMHTSVQEIAGRRVLRFSGKPPNPAAPRSRYADVPRESSVGSSGSVPAPARPAPSPVRRLAADVLPPVVTRAIRRRRRTT
ncbi:class I SAM-dependent methyltransferase [Streptomyces coffeae]|uniref:Class I SAM-dependent methyltransferase n=1 Tax=Streptomyces coffeae TaxID=621382 RepID=A0ABS1NJ01_9ACTN|nr:class I SAM-dependent methyltransferase [Streptomyces coffeae]MBL1099973.1 class I SAM-dependent methyltransferase [Streptomyces coffeae]